MFIANQVLEMGLNQSCNRWQSATQCRPTHTQTGAVGGNQNCQGIRTIWHNRHKVERALSGHLDFLDAAASRFVALFA